MWSWCWRLNSDLIFDPALPEIQLPGQAAKGQVLERAVDGGEPHVRLFLAGPLEQLLGRNVARMVQQGGQDHRPLGRQFQRLFPEIMAEGVHLGAAFLDRIHRDRSPFCRSFHGWKSLFN